VKPLLTLAAIVVGVPVSGASVLRASEIPWFRTPDDRAYCTFGDPFVCFRPSDGFYIRLKGIFQKYPTFTRGQSDRYRGYRNRHVDVLEFGQVRYSSDAEVITCWSRRQGVTCKHYDSGLTFWIGRRAGYRIFVQPPGRAPTVRPFFRTPFGAYCGLSLDNLEPSSPFLLCWTPRDGLLLSLVHSLSNPKAGYEYQEHVKNLRPRGYILLPAGHVFTWRCRSVGSGYAHRCSTRRGIPVFTCTSRVGGLTCRGRAGHGFWIGRARNFDVF
jgi:hypothetical protein